MQIVFSQLLRLICTCGSILVFASGLPIVYDTIQGRIPSFAHFKTFLIGLLSCGVWLIYGHTIQDETVTIVNLLGTLLYMSYCIFYVIFTVDTIDKNRRIKSIIIVMIILMLLLIYSTLFNAHNKSTIGLLADFLSTLFYISPIFELRKQFQVKNNEGLSYYLSITVFMSSSFWMIFGLYLKDIFILIPAFAGIACGFLELYVLYVFSSPATRL